MLKINKIDSRLQSYGQRDRAGRIAIQQQTVFIRTTPLDDEDMVDNTYGVWDDLQLVSLSRDPVFHEVMEEIGDSYTHNLADKTKQFFPVEKVGALLKELSDKHNLDLPVLSGARIEIRPALLFSQNVFYFVKDHPDVEEISHAIGEVLANHDLPAEMVNLTFTVEDSVPLRQMYRIVVLMAAILREAAKDKDVGFIPGRSIGTFLSIHEE